MANAENLVKNSQRTPSELREMTQKGGKRSGEVRRQKRDARESAKMILDCLLTKQDSDNVSLEFPCFKGVDIRVRDLLVSILCKSGMSGNSKDIAALLELAGEGAIKQQQIDLSSSDGSMSCHMTPEQTALKFAEMMDKINAEQSGQ